MEAGSCWLQPAGDVPALMNAGDVPSGLRGQMQTSMPYPGLPLQSRTAIESAAIALAIGMAIGVVVLLDLALTAS